VGRSKAGKWLTETTYAPLLMGKRVGAHWGLPSREGEHTPNGALPGEKRRGG